MFAILAILGYGMSCRRVFTLAKKLTVISVVRCGCSDPHSGSTVHNLPHFRWLNLRTRAAYVLTQGTSNPFTG